jgi:hypothetical protein
LALQYIFGLLILRWDVGEQTFVCLGDKVRFAINKQTNKNTNKHTNNVTTKGQTDVSWSIIMIDK